MTGPAALERRYRRLLAWYPRPFRSEQEDEVLAVLMAGARPGQRRPGLAEASSLIRSALRMRLRSVRPAPGNRDWTDALAVFSVVAPLFLLAAAVLEVAVPYRLPSAARISPGGRFILGRLFPDGASRQVGGLLLVTRRPEFDIAVGGLVVVAALALLGLRRVALMALAASVLYWIVTGYWIPDLPQVLFTGVYLLEAVALIASPGPRRGRQLLNWRHGVVLLVAAAAVQASTLMYDAVTFPARMVIRSPDITAYLVISIALALVAAFLAVALKLSRYLWLLLTAMLYPYAMQVAFSLKSVQANLIGNPSPPHLALLYTPPLLLACGAVLITITPRRVGVPRSSSPDKPGLT